MSSNHYDLILLGAGQIARSVIKACPDLAICVLSRDTSEISRDFGVACINWEAGAGKVPINLSASAVINCVLPQSKTQARAAIDAAISFVGEEGHYVHISSIAVNANHASFPNWLGFAGDGYIRIKKFERDYLHKNYPLVRIVYPGIVCGGETGWDKTLSGLRFATDIVAGAELNAPAPLTSLEILSGVLRTYALERGSGNEVFVPLKEHYMDKTWRDVIGEKKYHSSKPYIFFPSLWKEWSMIILTSRLTPDFVWSWLNAGLQKLKSRHENGSPSVSGKRHTLVAMTNFYITCHYE